jgi:hypothetical protein
MGTVKLRQELVRCNCDDDQQRVISKTGCRIHGRCWLKEQLKQQQTLAA